ncbi:MAG: DUF2946 family protein [Pseudomonadota bacterium]
MGAIIIKSVIFTIGLLAMLTSALAPTGFMPMQTDRGFAIVLCSGYGPELSDQSDPHAGHTQGMDHSEHAGGHGDHSQSDMENSTCTYAGASGNILNSAPPKLSDTQLVTPQHEPDRRRHFAVRNRLNIPPATGPPDFV